MAHLNGLQKKQRSSFITMLAAIVLVIAAIVYVLYGGLTAKSSLLENQDFAAALSETLGKAPAFITEEDLADVKYLSVTYDSNEGIAVLMTADEDFVTMYKEFMAKTEAGEDTSSYDFNGIYEYAEFDMDEETTLLDDVKYFTGAEVIEIAGVTFTDSSVFSGMTGLTHASVSSCGLTEVAGFAGLDAENVVDINLSGNNVEDWSPLDYIKDKVIVNSYYSFAPSEDGTIDFNNMTVTEQTLTEYYEELAAAEESENEDEDIAETGETEVSAEVETDSAE